MAAGKDKVFTILREHFISLNRTTDIGKIPITVLTDRAGISRSTFYSYFSDIYDLREQIESAILEELQNGLKVIPLYKNFREEMPSYNHLWLDNLKSHQEEIAVLCGPLGDGMFTRRLVKLRQEMVVSWMYRDDYQLSSMEGSTARLIRYMAGCAAQSEIYWIADSFESDSEEISAMEFSRQELFLRENVLDRIRGYRNEEPMHSSGRKMTGTSIMSGDEMVRLLSASPENPLKNTGAGSASANIPFQELLPDMLSWASKKAVCRCLGADLNFRDIQLVQSDIKNANVLLFGEAERVSREKHVSSINVTTTIEAKYVVAVAEAICR